MSVGNGTKALAAKLERSRDFYACHPHPDFPTISITGDSCKLCCKHCARHYLKGMSSCTTPEALLERCLEMHSKGVKGVLLSGGYNEEGYVPFEPFLGAIGKIKKRTGMFISAHTGLVPEELARKMGKAGIDLADFDMIGDDSTIELVLGIEKSVDDYRRSMKWLDRHLPYVVPHICVGLHAGELRGEFRALEIASEISPPLVVLLVLTPTHGTAFGGLAPPSPEDFEKVAIEARLRFPDAQLSLGCMRPRDSLRLKIELAALRSGVDRIELPAAQTIEAARSMGLKIRQLPACCSVPADVISELKL